MLTVDQNCYNHNLPLSLLTPIGAKNLKAIEEHVGTFEFLKGSNNKAIVVDWQPYDSQLNPKIFELKDYQNIHQPKQIWVTPDFKPYRKHYFEYFKDIENQNKFVVDHLFNRRLCKIWKFQFIRLIHVDRAVNSSSGKGQESFSVDLMKDDEKYWTKIKDRNITYADPFDLVKIVNLKIGKNPYSNVKDMFNFWYS